MAENENSYVWLQGLIRGEQGPPGPPDPDVTASLDTIDATVTTMITKTMVDNSFCTIGVRIMARQNSSANVLWYEGTQVYKRTGTAPVPLGDVVVGKDFSSVTWGGITWVVSGNDVQIKVSGYVGTGISWVALAWISEYATP